MERKPFDANFTGMLNGLRVVDLSRAVCGAIVDSRVPSCSRYVESPLTCCKRCEAQVMTRIDQQRRARDKAAMFTQHDDRFRILDWLRIDFVGLQPARGDEGWRRSWKT